MCLSLTRFDSAAVHVAKVGADGWMVAACWLWNVDVGGDRGRVLGISITGMEVFADRTVVMGAGGRAVT